ncbi:helix-turn-helix domain-containing protein (plasmid) [Deinococcus sp. KNUC1210]|uniref:substrate-binding domain-containing protein n=1 Tax=Deinococcus sp. KNUC1210 TaxID=2917691 RepID=UPI001EF04F53|nr:substrate-binding domain-containing protein [Deinococcus sp. KNUC1210]ULH17244.1 helix-turn-helix domain-containing protein [Deinococcus sp. KNUC1210]
MERSGLSLKSHVRQLRERAGLRPGELAQSIGLTRQALHSIETQAYVPNTLIAFQLARVLNCTVDELFTLSRPQVNAELIGRATLPTRVQLARLGERLLGFALTGEAGLGQAADGMASALETPNELAPGGAEAVAVELFSDLSRADQTAVLVGCDPSLGLAATYVARQRPQARLLWHSLSSTAALHALARNEAHAAGIHLYEAAPGISNLDAVQRELPGQRVHLFTLWSWEQGLMVAAGNPLRLHTPADLLRPGVRLVNREPGAGSRALLDAWLSGAGVSLAQRRQLPGYTDEVPGHLEAAALVASGQADAAPGPRSTAQALGLDFVPVQRERFDLVVPAAHLQHPAIAALLLAVQQPDFRAELAALGGYDPQHAGELWQTTSPALETP